MSNFIGKIRHYDLKQKSFAVEGLKGIHVVVHPSKDQYGNWSEEIMVMSEADCEWHSEIDQRAYDDAVAESDKVKATIETLKAHGFDDLVTSYYNHDLPKADYWCAHYINKQREQSDYNKRTYGFPTVLAYGLKSVKQAVFKAHQLSKG